MNASKHTSRVIVSAGCFADADAAITLATVLAQKVNGEVLGLMVEDDSISHFINLPFAKTVTNQSGNPRPLTTGAMTAAFQSDARSFKDQLEKTAEDSSVSWTFEYRRGRMKPVLRSIASKNDLILLSHQRTGISRGEIVFLDYIDSDDNKLLDMAIAIAKEIDVSIQIAYPLDSGLGTTKISLGARKHPVQAGALFLNEEEMLEYLGNTCLNAVFVAARPDQDVDIFKILDAARGPVVYSTQN